MNWQSDIATAWPPELFLRVIGANLYDWQVDVCQHYTKPTMVVAARQVGKTFCFAGLAYYTARRWPGSLSAVVCPDQDKSKTLVRRTKEIGAYEHIVWDPDNTEEIGYAGSRIVGLPGTVKGVVSQSAKLLTFDEAGLMLGQQGRDLYSAATPMQAHVQEPLTFAISSAWWQEGWFWEEWSSGTSYRKVLVVPRWLMEGQDIVPAEMDDKELAALWAKRGVAAFYSDYPTREFLEHEMTRHSERHMRQQYFCEFLERAGRMFSSAWIDRAIDDTIVPLFEGPTDDEVEPAGILEDVAAGR